MFIGRIKIEIERYFALRRIIIDLSLCTRAAFIELILQNSSPPTDYFFLFQTHVVRACVLQLPICRVPCLR